MDKFAARKKWVGVMISNPDNAIRFMTVSTQRSGSTWLTDLLNSHPDIASYTELFLLKGRGYPDWGAHKDMPYWQTYKKEIRGAGRIFRPVGLFHYLDEVFMSHSDKHAVGLKLMYTQIVKYPETLLYMRSRKVRIIHLIRRNALDVVISDMAKKARNVAHVSQGESIEQIRIHIDPDILLRKLFKRQREQRWFARLLSHFGLPYLELAYEDILDDRKHLDECLMFLGCSQNKLDSKMSKINPSSHADLITNIDDIASIIKNTPFANMLRI